ncbi:TonB family protein [Acinetobacter halotolerans]|uniref:TonB family protein n=1 Tax=Acinetobacter halotolerans TaxID=1752076 RepID=A0A4Q6XIQ4_9GAMM|nr:TonB family protein [Acinetobacter halotolerans]RZF53108.1 TonB family protein [Acinetobacter halotolerans]
MSPSPAAFNTSSPMKKKIITALVAVVIGHVGVLWAVSHIKTIELKPIEKEPLKVRFLTIKEDAPPPSPKVEPIKPKVEPKPIEKKIEPIPVEKPKIISQKVQKVEPKVIQQDDTQEKLKKQQDLEKQRLEQLQREQALKEQQAREQALREQQAREQALREQQAREQASQNQPKSVSAGDISWSRKPVISREQVARYFKAEDGEITISLDISSDGTGKVTNVKVTKSSGNEKFDAYVIRQTYAARFKSYKVNGVVTPFVAPQPFSVSVVGK